jgi:ESAT-6 protein secretion system EspG family protein
MVGAAVAVDVAEVDLLCASAGCPPPFPLRAPEFGRDVAERRASLHAAGARLAERGLADEQGPLGVAEAFAHLLASAAHTMDLVLSLGSDVYGAVLLAKGDLAVLAVQRLTAPETIRMAELPLDDAVDELLGLIPHRDAALVSPFAVPGAAVRRVHEALRGAREPLDPRAWEDLLSTNGIDESLSRRMVTHLQPVVGGGQAGLAERAGYAKQWRRTGTELRWLDTERGRLQLVTDPADDAWLSVNPLHTNDLHTALRRTACLLQT